MFLAYEIWKLNLVGVVLHFFQMRIRSAYADQPFALAFLRSHNA